MPNLRNGNKGGSEEVESSGGSRLSHTRFGSLYTDNGRHKPILGHKEISMTPKTQIIKAVFTPTLLYRSENWTLTSKERLMLTTTEMRCLRKAAGKTRMDKIRNEEIANSKQEQDQVAVTRQEDGTNNSPE